VTGRLQAGAVHDRSTLEAARCSALRRHGNDNGRPAQLRPLLSREVAVLLRNRAANPVRPRRRPPTRSDRRLRRPDQPHLPHDASRRRVQRLARAERRAGRRQDHRDDLERVADQSRPSRQPTMALQPAWQPGPSRGFLWPRRPVGTGAFAAVRSTLARGSGPLARRLIGRLIGERRFADHQQGRTAAGTGRAASTDCVGRSAGRSAPLREARRMAQRGHPSHSDLSWARSAHTPLHRPRSRRCTAPP
jgi:hypothetical protein